MATTERARTHRERQRQREALELQKQINALDATIERLHKRTKQKIAALDKVITETMKEIKHICTHREDERRSVLGQKRQITKELFLRQFRSRQLLRRNLRIRLGLTPGNPIRQKFTGSAGPIPVSLAAREESELDALSRWSAAEDVRDEAEIILAQRMEQDATTKATSRLSWLKDMATAQLHHLEEFIQVNHPTGEESSSDPREVQSESQLPQLREKHHRLVGLLQKYGVSSGEDDDKSSKTIQQLCAEDTLPTTVALRTLWSELEEEKLYKLQQQTISEFERLISGTYRTAVGRRVMSPKFRRRYQWRRDAYIYREFTKPLTTKAFSYFEFRPTFPNESSEEDEDGQELIRSRWSRPSTSTARLLKIKNSERLSEKESPASWRDQRPMRYNLKAS